MKILLINNCGLTHRNDDFYLDSKTGQFSLDLKGLGHDITWYGTKIPSKESTIHTFGIIENGMFVKGLWLKKNKIANYLFLYLRIIPEIFKTDFVYIFYPNAFKYVAFIALLFNKRYGIYLRGMEGIDDCISKIIYKNAFVVFTVSNVFTEYVNSISAKPIASTIRPMISFTAKDIVKDRNYNRKDKYNILFLGRLSLDKGIQELLEAVFVLLKRRKDFNLQVVGDGDVVEKLKEFTIKTNICEYVFFKGGVYDNDEIRTYYLNSDIYILPTYHEGFPRTLYEAMIFGTPIITTFVGGIPGVMIDGYNCKKIEARSVNSIVDELDNALTNYKYMGDLAKCGSETISNILYSKECSHAFELNNIINGKK